MLKSCTNIVLKNRLNNNVWQTGPRAAVVADWSKVFLLLSLLKFKKTVQRMYKTVYIEQTLVRILVVQRTATVPGYNQSLVTVPNGSSTLYRLQTSSAVLLWPCKYKQHRSFINVASVNQMLTHFLT